MFEKFDNRVNLSGQLTTLTALRVGAGRATGVKGTDLPVVRDAIGLPYIPGSSFKGAVRSAIESLVRGVSRKPSAACNPISQDEWCLKSPEGLTDEQVEEKTCLVCSVFGSPWLASKVNIRDILVDKETWFDQYEVRNGVAIERDTETAADKKLYDFEVVPAGTRFSCEIIMENGSAWELGLLMIGLRPFELGEAALGGARSRGLGVVKIEWNSRTQIGSGDLLSYLAGDSKPSSVDDDKIKDWVRSFRAKLEDLPNA
jgi:CRISPR-associated RAMP protein (TIGR02581 family)